MKKRLLALFLAVTLLASFLAVGAQALVAADFSDVPEGSWYYEDVDFVAKNNLMQGYPDGSFKPSKYLTREELMMILARMDNTNRAESAKYDLSKADAAPFEDVAADRWSAPAVQWAKEKGITVGNNTDSTTFNPTGELTRQELATFVDRFVKYYLASHTNVKLAPKNVVEEEFPDLTDAASWAQASITACRVNGLIYGFEDGLFHPYRVSTRAQIAAIIHRLAVELQIITPEPGPDTKTYHTFTLTYHYVDEAGAKLQDDLTVKNTVETSVTSVTFTVLDTTPTREGYTFKEWNTKADGTGTAYAPTAKFTTDKLSNDLYTIWTKNEAPTYRDFHLYYHFVDEAGTELQATKDVKNSELTEKKTSTWTVEGIGSLTREGYTFKEWNTKADGTGEAYAPGSSFTSGEDVLESHLYTIWTKNETPPPEAAKYTLTYNYNIAGTADDVTEAQTSRNFTVKAPVAEKVPTGYTFLYWTTEQSGSGDRYYENDTFTAPEGQPATTTNSTLYAQWLAGDDYIGRAVYATMGFLNDRVVARTAGDGELARENINIDVDTLLFNGEIKPADTRKQSASAKVELTEDLLPGLIRFTAQTVATILESTDGLKSATKEEIEAIIDEIVAEVEALTGIDLPEYRITTVKSEIVQEIKDTRSVGGSAVNGVRKALADIWKLDGKYIASECSIEVLAPSGSRIGNAVVATIDTEAHFAGGLAKAGATLGRNLAKALVQNLKTYTGEYVNVVDLKATVKFTFKDSAELTASEQKYPHVYPVDLQLTLDGADLISYRYADGGYLLFTISKATQEAYTAAAEEVAKAALSNQKIMRTVNTELQKGVDQVLAYKAFVQCQKLFEQFGRDVNVAEQIAQWAVDNHFADIVPSANGEVSDFINSPLFKRFWGGEVEEQVIDGFTFTDLYYDNSAILHVLNELGDVVAEKTEEGLIDTLDEIPPSMRDAMYKSFMAALTVKAYYETDLDKYGVDVDLLSNPNYKPLLDYILAKAADKCHAKVGDGELQTTADVIEAACKNVEDLIEEKMPGQQYLGKVTGLKDLKRFQNVSLGDLAKLLNNGKLRDKVGNAAKNLIKPLQKLIKRIPSSASVSIVLDDGSKITLSKAAMDGIRAASNTSELLDAVVAFMTSSDAVKALTLADFEIGSEKLIQISFRGQIRGFHFGVHFE